MAETSMAKSAKDMEAPNVEPAGRKSQEQSPLMRLPAELRNRIYSEVFIASNVALKYYERCKVPGVLTACQQVHEEVIGLFYSETIFKGCDEDFSAWVTRIPEKWVAAVHHVHIHTDPWYNNHGWSTRVSIAAHAEATIKKLLLNVPRHLHLALSTEAVQGCIKLEKDEAEIWTSTPFLTCMESLLAKRAQCGSSAKIDEALERGEKFANHLREMF